MERRSSSLGRCPSLSYGSPSAVAAAVNVANFVPTKLQWLSGIPDTNYETWKQQMELLLESQGLLEYVDGTITLPLGPNLDYAVWKRTDALVKGWIVGSLTDQIASTTVVRDKAAHHVWVQLATKFGRPEKDPNYPHYEKTKKCVNDSTPLHRAALEGDWEAAQLIFNVDPHAKTSWIDGNQNWTALHIAVGTGEKAIHFVRNLVQLLAPQDLLALRDAGNSTALHIAASVGNRAAAALLVEKNPAVCNQQNKHGHFPIHVAALYVQREVLEYLIQHTKPDEVSDPYADREGQQLLTYLIQSDFFDIALELAEKYPSLLEITSLEDGDDVDSPLALLTTKMKALSTRNLGVWEHFISSRILPLETNLRSHSTSNRAHDIEGITNDTTQILSGNCFHLLSFNLQFQIIVSQS